MSVRDLDEVLDGMTGEDLEQVRAELRRLRAIEERVQALLTFYEDGAGEGLSTSCVTVTMAIRAALQGEWQT